MLFMLMPLIFFVIIDDYIFFLIIACPPIIFDFFAAFFIFFISLFTPSLLRCSARFDIFFDIRFSLLFITLCRH